MTGTESRPGLGFDEALRRSVADRLAGFERLDAASAPGGLKRAAVAIALVPVAEGSREAAFLLTFRAPRLRSHNGQYALPGGRCDAGETATAAALREMHEEVGLRLGEDQVLGLLDDYPTRSGYLVTPVVVWGGESPKLHPNPDEVAVLHRVPLADIADAGAAQFFSIPESDRLVIRIWIAGDWVHAPTTAILHQFSEVALHGRATRVAHIEQPVFAWR